MGIPALRRQPGDSSQTVSAFVDSLTNEAVETVRGRRAISLLKDAGVMPSSESSSSALAPIAKSMGDLFSGVASGMKGFSEMQQTYMKSVMDGLTGQVRQGGQDPMMMMLVLKLFEMLETRQSGGEDNFWRNQYVELVNGQITELKGRQGASPIDSQMYELTQRMTAEAFARAADPLGSLKDLARSREALRDALGFVGGDGGAQYSEGALRMAAINQDGRKIELQYNDQVAQREYLRDILQQGVPTWIAALGNTAQQVLGMYGLTPVYQNQIPGQQARQPDGRPFSRQARGVDGAQP